MPGFGPFPLACKHLEDVQALKQALSGALTTSTLRPARPGPVRRQPLDRTNVEGLAPRFIQSRDLWARSSAPGRALIPIDTAGMCPLVD
eukprot:m.541159 g.541159  ORF g.541159 m.541159 type:complete len:89 (+) comp57645_c0_seq7:428-694(+)